MNRDGYLQQLASDLGWSLEGKQGARRMVTHEPLWAHNCWALKTMFQAAVGYDSEGTLTLEVEDPDPAARKEALAIARSAQKLTYLSSSYARPRATRTGSNRRLRALLTANAAGGGTVDRPLTHEDASRHTGPDGTEILCLDEGWGFPLAGAPLRLDEGREDPFHGTVMWEPEDPEGRIYGLPDWAKITAHEAQNCRLKQADRPWKEQMKTPIFAVPTTRQMLSQLEDFTRERAEEEGCRQPRKGSTVAQVFAAYQNIRARTAGATDSFRVPEKTAQLHLDWMDQLAMDIQSELSSEEVLAILTLMEATETAAP